MKLKKKPQGRKYTKRQEIDLCAAYVEVTSDPTVGTNMSTKELWTKAFERLPEETKRDRTWETVKSHCMKIKRLVTKYAGKLKAIQDDIPSGWDQVRIIEGALKDFKADNRGVDFKFMHCYAELSKLQTLSVVEKPTTLVLPAVGGEAQRLVLTPYKKPPGRGLSASTG